MSHYSELNVLISLNLSLDESSTGHISPKISFCLAVIVNCKSAFVGSSNVWKNCSAESFK